MPFDTYSYDENGLLKFGDTSSGQSLTTAPTPYAIDQARQIDYRNTGEVKPLTAFVPPPKPTLESRGATAEYSPSLALAESDARAQADFDKNRTVSDVGPQMSSMPSGPNVSTPPEKNQSSYDDAPPVKERRTWAPSQQESQQQSGGGGEFGSAMKQFARDNYAREMSRPYYRTAGSPAMYVPQSRSTESQSYDPQQIEDVNTAVGARFQAAAKERKAKADLDKEQRGKESFEKFISDGLKGARKSSYEEKAKELSEKEKEIAESKGEDDRSPWAKIAEALAVGLGQYAAVMSRTENMAGKIASENDARRADRFNKRKAAMLANVERERDITLRDYDKTEAQQAAKEVEAMQRAREDRYINAIADENSALSEAQTARDFADEFGERAANNLKYTGQKGMRLTEGYRPAVAAGVGGGPNLKAAHQWLKEGYGVEKDEGELAAKGLAQKGPGYVRVGEGDMAREIELDPRLGHEEGAGVRKAAAATGAMVSNLEEIKKRRGLGLPVRDGDIESFAASAGYWEALRTYQGQATKDQIESAQARYRGLAKEKGIDAAIESAEGDLNIWVKQYEKRGAKR